jgi:predicted aminopeptidase
MEKGKKKSGKFKDNSNVPYLKRDSSSEWVQGKKFIMDVLRDAAIKERSRLLIEMDQVFKPLNRGLDAHLVKPWADAEAWAKRGDPIIVEMKKADLKRISEHVQAMYQQQKRYLQNDNRKNNTSATVQFTELPIETRQDKLRASSKAFASGPQIEELPTIADAAMLARYRASYAYKYDSETSYGGWGQFPWNVAMRELCLIKAAALGPYKAVTNNFYERFKLVRRI